LKEVTIIAASDDYWYYSLQSADGRYGMANADGEVVLSPQYRQLNYCPIKSEGNEQFYATGRLFTLHTHQTRGAFIARDGQATSIVTTDGKEQAKLTDNCYTYYHGYIFGGCLQNGLQTMDAAGTTLLTAFSKDNDNSLSLLTSDGRLLAKDLVGISIENRTSPEAHQALNTMQIIDGTLRLGGRLLDTDKGPVLPPIFFTARYNVKNDEWRITTEPLANSEVYDPRRHTTVTLNDDGERLYAQQRYDEAANFYRQRNSDPLKASAHDQMYLAAALYNIGQQHFDELQDATRSFEDLEDGDYAYYYNDRFKMRLWPSADLERWSQAHALVSNYLNDTLQAPQYTKAARRIQQQIESQKDEYASCQSRYDYALNTLDERIASLKERQRHEAEERARLEAEQAALQRQVVMSGINFGQQLGQSILSAVEPSKKSSKSKRTSGLNIDNSSIGGVKAKDLPHHSDDSDEEAETSSSSKSKSKSSSKSCHSCYGDGKCPVCDGKGVYIPLGKTAADGSPCDHCHKTGKCPDCKGTGKR